MSNRPKIVVDNPDTLAPLIRDMGGTVISGTSRFLFDLPLNKVADVVPKLVQLGLRVTKEGEYLTRTPVKARYEPMSVARLGLRYREED